MRGGEGVEFATLRGGEEEGEEEVPRRLVTPKGVGGYTDFVFSQFLIFDIVAEKLFL